MSAPSLINATSFLLQVIRETKAIQDLDGIHSAEFLVIGGVAVGYHIKNRVTQV